MTRERDILRTDGGAGRRSCGISLTPRILCCSFGTLTAHLRGDPLCQAFPDAAVTSLHKQRPRLCRESSAHRHCSQQVDESAPTDSSREGQPVQRQFPCRNTVEHSTDCRQWLGQCQRPGWWWAVPLLAVRGAGTRAADCIDQLLRNSGRRMERLTLCLVQRLTAAWLRLPIWQDPCFRALAREEEGADRPPKTLRERAGQTKGGENAPAVGGWCRRSASSCARSGGGCWSRCWSVCGAMRQRRCETDGQR